MGQPRGNGGGYTDRSAAWTETATRLNLLNGGWSGHGRPGWAPPAQRTRAVVLWWRQMARSRGAGPWEQRTWPKTAACRHTAS
jgi:hypothetical protein